MAPSLGPAAQVPSVDRALGVQVSGKTNLHRGLGHKPCRPQIHGIKTEGIGVQPCLPLSLTKLGSVLPTSSGLPSSKTPAMLFLLITGVIGPNTVYMRAGGLYLVPWTYPEALVPVFPSSWEELPPDPRA